MRDGNLAHETAPPLDITTSKGMLEWMTEQHAGVAFTTYTGGKLFLLGPNGGQRLSVFERSFDRTLGLAHVGNQLIMASQFQIWRFGNALAPGQTADGYDRLYVPQVAYTTGDLQVHDIAVAANGKIVFANTLFSCIAAVNEEYSFTPLWRPKFVTALAPEDRCHLTGLAMEHGLPRYVTVSARTDRPQGWKDDTRSGAVIDAQKGDIVCEGLSFPSSPRVIDGRLWLHESGSGYFGYVDMKTGTFERVVLCPGFVRGLDVVGDFAVAAASKLHEGEALDGLPLAAALRRHRAEARCAVLVIDLKRGALMHWVRVEGIIDEIYDIAILPGCSRPAAIGLRGDDIKRVISIAPDKPAAAKAEPAGQRIVPRRRVSAPRR
ncbi:MAG: TIGR03032 family protein [Alphaproteobacteria bacterium]